jgi:hypothetical protein
MHISSPRSILAASAVFALMAAALGPTAAFARGPGPAGDRGGVRAVDQRQQGGRAQGGTGEGGQQRTRARLDIADEPAVRTRAGDGQSRRARTNASSVPNEAGMRGPGSCDVCDAEMGTLADDQAAGLVFMANEEKLAHDVYAFFAQRYSVPIFENIAAAEARHQVAVNAVLERHGLDDPAMRLPAGSFSDPAIGTLYATFVGQGSASLAEAIAVGVLIEKTDIADLESRMADLLGEDDTPVAPDVYHLYSHLLAGSQNHLAAFQGWR